VTPGLRDRDRAGLGDSGIVCAAFALLVAEFAGLPLPWILWGLLGLGAASYVLALCRWLMRRRRTP
jgi:hypothetical protein